MFFIIRLFLGQNKYDLMAWGLLTAIRDKFSFDDMRVLGYLREQEDFSIDMSEEKQRLKKYQRLLNKMLKYASQWFKLQLTPADYELMGIVLPVHQYRGMLPDDEKKAGRLLVADVAIWQRKKRE